MVHGELGGSWVWERYLGYFAGRGWEGHALNLRNHHWSSTADPAELSFETYTEDVVAAMDRLGPNTVAIGHGLGGLLVLKASERMPLAAVILISPEPARDLREPVRPHELREIPDAYGRSIVGWETLPERLQRDNRDLTIEDVLRIQHLMGQKPHESGQARRQMLPGCRSTHGPSWMSRGWSSAVGWTAPFRWPTRSVSPGGSTPSSSRSGAFALRARPRRTELPAGRGDDPRVPRAAPPVGPRPARAPDFLAKYQPR